MSIVLKIVNIIIIGLKYAPIIFVEAEWSFSIYKI